MLSELCTHELAIYTRTLRQAKDAYTARKVQKDRLKVKRWLDTLLNDREVIIFYKDGDEEKMTVATRRKFLEKEEWPDLQEMPLTEEIINNQKVLEEQHVQFWTQPMRQPVTIHIDSITKFIVPNRGLIDLSNKMKLED